MKKNLTAFIILLTLGIGCKSNTDTKVAGSTTSDTSGALATGGPTAAQVTLQTNMRKLWEDHIVWTRNVILNVTDNLPGLNEAVARLQSNQDDIGNAIKPYYGDAAGTQLAALLHGHISTAAEVLTAAKSGVEAKLNAAQAKWTANADSIAAFLSSANASNWPAADMKNMMHDHLKLTTDEAVARLKKNYPGDIAAYDEVHKQILHMADMLTEGIVKQFPDKF